MRALHLEPSQLDDETRGLLERVLDLTTLDTQNRAALLAAVRADAFEVVFLRLGVRADVEFFEAARGLRFLATPTTGLDHIDLDAARHRGVRVISLKGEAAFLENVHATAEHTFALLFALLRKIPHAHNDVVRGFWRRWPFEGSELHGRTLGIAGCGRLGRKVAGYALAFGMRVLAFDKDVSATQQAPRGTSPVSMDALLKESDVVSMHLSLDASTRGFFSRSYFSAMRPGSVFINTARGELVDEAALLDSLTTGHLAGAALDVIADDGGWGDVPPYLHPLIEYAKTHDNLILTPHIGGYSRESIRKTRHIIAKRVIEAVTGGEQEK